LSLPVHAPYDWDTTLAYLRRHAIYGVERVDADYRRAVIDENRVGWARVAGPAVKGALSVEFTNVPLAKIRFVLGRLRRLFDTDHNPAHLPAALAARAGGLRVPGCFDPFETAVSIVLSQVVSTSHAAAALEKLVRRFGRPVDGLGVIAFPAPSQLRAAPVESIGVTKSKARAIRALAAAVDDRRLSLAEHADVDKTKRALLALPGVGPWTAEIVAMRCLADPTAFPASDLIVRREILAGRAAVGGGADFAAYWTHSLWRDAGARKIKRRTHDHSIS
jgi:AraC family transcriptional regulator of adaptative response / DNA-3-methyladenine glycosylase II